MIIALFIAIIIVFQAVAFLLKKSHIVDVSEHYISIRNNKLYGLSRAIGVWLVLAIFAIIAHVTDQSISIEKRADPVLLTFFAAFGLMFYLAGFATTKRVFDLSHQTLTIGSSVYAFSEFSHLKYGIKPGKGGGPALSVILKNGKSIFIMVSSYNKEVKALNKLLHEKLSLNTKARKADGLFNYVEVDTDYAK